MTELGLVVSLARSRNTTPATKPYYQRRRSAMSDMIWCLKIYCFFWLAVRSVVAFVDKLIIDHLCWVMNVSRKELEDV